MELAILLTSRKTLMLKVGDVEDRIRASVRRGARLRRGGGALDHRPRRRHPPRTLPISGNVGLPPLREPAAKDVPRRPA
jgi:hypothetical protein